MSCPARGLHGQVGLTQAKARQEPLLLAPAAAQELGIKLPTLLTPCRRMKQLLCSGSIESPGSGGEPHSPWARTSISEQRKFQMAENSNTVCDYPLDPSAPGDLGQNSSIKHMTIHTPARNKDHK